MMKNNPFLPNNHDEKKLPALSKQETLQCLNFARYILFGQPVIFFDSHNGLQPHN